MGIAHDALAIELDSLLRRRIRSGMVHLIYRTIQLTNGHRTAVIIVRNDSVKVYDEIKAYIYEYCDPQLLERVVDRAIAIAGCGSYDDDYP